jgi:hypothetical protein
MKMHGAIAAHNVQLTIPNGPKLPNNPQLGEIFFLTLDEQETNLPVAWHGRGLYTYDYGQWNMISDSSRQRRSSIIASQVLEVEIPTIGDDLPSVKDGFEIASVGITPSNRKASFSGAASFWAEHSVGGHLIVVVFRGRKPVSVSVDYFDAFKPRTVSVSFVDLPFALEHQTYTIRAYTDKAGFVNINQSKFYGFDGASQTAFSVMESI